MTAAVRVITITADELREIIREELARATPAAAPVKPSGYLSVPQAAEYASVSRDTIRDWISAGRLPHRRVGRHYRVTRDDLDRALANHGAPSKVDLGARAMAIIRRAR